jgi:hypothetical protein
MSKFLNQNEKIDLKKLMSNNSDYVDNTNNIRNLKHSVKIFNDLKKMDIIRGQHNISNEDILEKCKTECNFLFNYYTDIFNKYYNDLIDINILAKLIKILELIENDKINQQEGSFMAGKILKELYIDSALQYSKKKDKEFETKIIINNGLKLSWKDYKNNNKIA